MDVNDGSLNMDNWENSDSFSVIVSEDDVLGAIPDSDTHSSETLHFSATHDISLTKDNDNLEEEHVSPSSQCFNLDKQPVVDLVPQLSIGHQESEHLIGDSDSVSGIDIMHQDNEHMVSDSDHISGINLHQQNDSESVAVMDVHEESEQLIDNPNSVSGFDIVQQHEELISDADRGSDRVSRMDISLSQDREQLMCDTNSDEVSGIILAQQNSQLMPVTESGQGSEINITTLPPQNEQMMPNADSVSGVDISLHHQNDQLLSDSDHAAGMDIEQHENLIADTEESDVAMKHESEQLIHSHLVTGIDIENTQDELIDDAVNLPGLSIVHHQNEQQLLQDSDTVPEMDIVHNENEYLVSDPAPLSDIDIAPAQHESEQHVNTEAGSGDTDSNYESHEIGESKTCSGIELNQVGKELATDSGSNLSVLNIVNESNNEIEADVDHVTEINSAHEREVFQVDANITNNADGNASSEQMTSLTDANGTNIGEGIDILAKASLGLLNDNIFNKESVNQIKDIVASTIANFSPTNNQSTEVLSAINEHGYTSVDIPPHPTATTDQLFENTIENFTSHIEDDGSPTTKSIDIDIKNDLHTGQIATHDGDTMSRPTDNVENIVIPVSLAEVSSILDVSCADGNSVHVSNQIEDVGSVGCSEPEAPNIVEESKVPHEHFGVVCGENIEIVESVEICMESSSAEVSFESPNSTLQPQHEGSSKAYYENIKNTIEEQDLPNETITFHAVESNLLTDSQVNNPSTTEEPQVNVLSSSDAIPVTTDTSHSFQTINTNTVLEFNEPFTLSDNENNQARSDVKIVPEKPQPAPMKVSISTSGTSKKVIVLLPSRVVGHGVDKQKDSSPRSLQKIRPGVKLSNRNLTSQIVSTEEIAKELYLQGLKKTPVRDLPQGGDLFYSRHLTKRLANRIVPSVASTSTLSNISQPIKSSSNMQNISVKPKPKVQNIVSIKPQSKIQNVITVTPQSKVQKFVSMKTQPEVQTLSIQASNSNSDSEDLLAILEGDVDEWSIERPPPQLIEAVSSPVTVRNSPPRLDSPLSINQENPLGKLDPLLEKELALQQLNSLDAHNRNKKDSSNKTRRKSKIQVKEDFDEVIVEEDGIIIGQPVVLIEDVKKKLPWAPKLKKSLKRQAPSESPNRVQVLSKGSADGVPVKKRKLVHVGASGKGYKKAIKTPKLVNGKVNAKSEKTPPSNKEKKLAADSKAKQGIKKEGDLDQKPKPSDNTTEKSKTKKRKNLDDDAFEFVGPISRNMPPPPRTYSARIKRSPMFTDFIVDHLPSTSKNKAASVVALANKNKSVSPDISVNKKEQKSVTKSQRLSTPSKDVPSTPKNVSTNDDQTILPMKGRESDPEKNVKKEKGGRKKLSEIERLLMDEGAINMLYSVKQDEENRRGGGGSPGTSAKKNVLKSTRRSHKDLIMKTRLVKNAVLHLSNSPDSPQASHRTKRMSGPPSLKTSLSDSESKEPQDSNETNLSSPPHVPFGIPSPGQVFTYPSKIHLAAEASRIIRRHSSSSNFSSRSASPNPSRRLSAEAASPQPVSAENETVDSSDGNYKQTRKKGVPIFVKKEETTHTYKAKKKKYSHNSSPTTDTVAKFQDSQEFREMQKPSYPITKKPTPSSKTKLKAQLTKPLQKITKGKVLTSVSSKGKRTSLDKVRSKDEDPNGNIPDLTTCLAEAATAFITDDENPTSPGSLNQNRLVDSKKLIPVSSNATSYSNLIKSLETDSQKRQDGEDSGKERSSARQSVGSFHYKELSLRRYDAMVQVILTPSTKMKNALSLQVLRELRDVLNQLRKDDTCRAVLVTSTGSSFCQGLDFQSLINDKPERRKAAAQELALAVTKFMTSLAYFNKLIIAGVHGDAVGLGVTMLPFFDMVFASDKATFYTPYARLGQIPEGAAVITLPLMLGNAVTSELLFGCRKLTASEALHYGLVTRILWPDRFQEELLPIIRSLANQSAQSMEATKALLRHSIRSKLDSALEAESHLLIQHWTSSECQNNFKRYLDDEDVGPQRQKVDP